MSVVLRDLLAIYWHVSYICPSAIMDNFLYVFAPNEPYHTNMDNEKPAVVKLSSTR